MSNVDNRRSTLWYLERLRGFGELVGAHFRMVEDSEGKWVYNKDAVIQFRHPDHAAQAVRAINTTGLMDTRNNQMWAEPHIEEFNLTV